MKMCPDHWSRLRAAISDRGLDDLVAKGGVRAARNLKSEIEDGPSMANFDPLMGAHNAILNNALDNMPHGAALGMLTSPDDAPEQGCPLCVLNANVPNQAEPNSFDVWIERAADDMKKLADEMRSAG
jgi:hypothetical protein